MAAFNGSTDALFGDDFFAEFSHGGDFLVGGLPEAVWPLSDGETGASSGPAASLTSLRKSPSFLLIPYSVQYLGLSLSFLYFFISIFFSILILYLLPSYCTPLNLFDDYKSLIIK